MVAHACHLSTQATETGVQTHAVWGQPGLQGKISNNEILTVLI